MKVTVKTRELLADAEPDQPELPEDDDDPDPQS